jgi:NAD(P)-dependent dehydrogenase (short-subunit alcohol dehydrogenase family)
MSADEGKGRLAVVTGGASGIGESCAELLAERGFRVVVADRDADRASDVASRIGGMAFAVDVADTASIETLAKRVETECGPAEVLVTSAGITQRPLPPEELSVHDWDSVMAIDLRGTYLCCRSFGAAMARRSGGSIVTIASVAGSRSMPLHSYAPAKAAVIQMSRCLATEWGPSGVRVNSVSPGYTLTPLVRNLITDGQRDPSALIATAAMGRMVEPREVAEAVVFLASDRSSAITGVDIPVDAGWLVAPSWTSYGGLRPDRRRAGA